MKDPNKHTERLLVSYGLCALCFIGLGGVHRFYNGKIGTGLLWLFTWGIFGVGQFVDLFLIPNMVDEYEIRLQSKYGMLPGGRPAPQQTITSGQVAVPKVQKLEVEILKAAQKRGGKISVTQAVLDTGGEFVEIEEILKEMVKKGYAHIDNDPIKGGVIYDFIEL